MRKLILLFLLTYFSALIVRAQDSEDAEISGVESEIEKNIPSGTTDTKTSFPLPNQKKTDVLDMETLKESSEKDKITIQKNYMPKTDRVQGMLGLTYFPSDVFFKTMGLQGRVGYHFNETWGLELTGILLGSARSQELKDLENKQGVTADNVSSLKGYWGGQIYFSSMYGKYAFLDRRILPFEIYQTVGFGQMTTDRSTNPALSLGVGQLISLTRSSALRLDLNLLMYQIDNINGDKSSQSSILITVGYSPFFPKLGGR